MINKIIERLSILTQSVIYLFDSLFWKRQNDVILFGAWFGEKFADNPRFLFQYLSENRKALGFTHVIWVSWNADLVKELKEMGYEAYMMNTKESVHYHKIAKYHIICNASERNQMGHGDIMGRYSYGAIRINLGHGTAPIKGDRYHTNKYAKKKEKHPNFIRFKEWLLKNSKIFRLIYAAEGGWGDEYMISTSCAATSILQNFFLLPRKNFIQTGYPRNCKVLRLLKEEQEVMNIIKNYSNLILYLPTFRKTGNFTFEALSASFDDFLRENDILWIQKAHAADLKNITSKQMNGNTLELPSDFDINVLIPEISCLITDYSSVWIDAIYHRKPLIFYVPDYERYQNGEEGFAYDPNEIFECGEIAKNIEELLKSIKLITNTGYRVKEKLYQEAYVKWWEKARTYDEIWNDIRHIELES